MRSSLCCHGTGNFLLQAHDAGGFREHCYRKGDEMKQEEKKPVNWEVTDPKPPVVRSGHLENRKQN